MPSFWRARLCGRGRLCGGPLTRAVQGPAAVLGVSRGGMGGVAGRRDAGWRPSGSGPTVKSRKPPHPCPATRHNAPCSSRHVKRPAGTGLGRERAPPLRAPSQGRSQALLPPALRLNNSPLQWQAENGSFGPGAWGCRRVCETCGPAGADRPRISLGSWRTAEKQEKRPVGTSTSAPPMG